MIIDVQLGFNPVFSFWLLVFLSICSFYHKFLIKLNLFWGGIVIWINITLNISGISWHSDLLINERWEYVNKLTDLLKGTTKLYHIRLYWVQLSMSENQTYNFSGNRHSLIVQVNVNPTTILSQKWFPRMFSRLERVHLYKNLKKTS